MAAVRTPCRETGAGLDSMCSSISPVFPHLAASEVPSPRALPTPAIHFASIADLDHEYAQHIILYLAHHAKITHTITPQAAQRSGQRFASAAWGCRAGDAIMQKRRDTSGGLAAELGQFPPGGRGQFNPPSQARAPHRPA